MKKLISIILALVLVLSFAACSSEPADDSQSEGEQQSQSEEQSQEEQSESKKYVIGICQLVQHEALDLATKGFRDAVVELIGEENVEFIEQNASNDPATCSTICNQFVSENVDLIMANATSPLQAAASATNVIPVVGTSITDYATALDIDVSDWTGKTGTNITGTSDLAPLSEQAEMIHELFPDAKTVGILYCSGEPNSLYQANVIQPVLEGMGYTVERFTFVDSNDVAAVTTTACSSSDVLYIPTDNTAASCTETINNVALPAGTPIVAGESGICAGCGVSALSISYYDIGYAAGEMAVEILVNGADPGDIDIGFAPEVVKMYNADICSALGITPPEDYVAIG